jgi:hypothetical protein
VSKKRRTQIGQSQLASRRYAQNGSLSGPRKQTQAQEGMPRSALTRRAWSGWKEFWAFVGPLALIASLWINFTPSITIEPSANVDPQREYATQFLITNRGHVPVYDARFSCSIGVGGGLTTIDGTLTPPDLRPVGLLASGQSVTRSCDVGLDVQGNTRIRFEVSFVWPLIGHHGTRQAIFSLRRGSPGYFLVPDSVP